MRKRSQLQLYFKPQSPMIAIARELEETTTILNSLPNYHQLISMVHRDLGGDKCKSNAGRKGMTAEQVLLASIVKSRKGYSYRGLSTATKDSIAIRNFLMIRDGEEGFSHTALSDNISKIKESTLDYMNELLKDYAASNGIDDGSKTRSDATTTETNIHYPTDSSLMHDSNKVLTRIMTIMLEVFYVPIVFQNHYRASKKRIFKINNCRKLKKRTKLNIELISLSKNTVGFAKKARSILAKFEPSDEVVCGYSFTALKEELDRVVPLAEQVIDVAERRIVNGESVPASEKVFSIFEPHTDIIVKGHRDVVFGHKSTITTGKSGIILDIIIHEGNPADSTIVKDILKRHTEYYGTAPESSVYDGCYESDENRELLIEAGVSELSFSKETEQNATVGKAVRKALRYFRAGIEATVSMLKRIFGFTRVMNKGLENFHKTLKSGVVAYNLFILARANIKA